MRDVSAPGKLKTDEANTPVQSKENAPSPSQVQRNSDSPQGLHLFEKLAIAYKQAIKTEARNPALSSYDLQVAVYSALAESQEHFRSNYRERVKAYMDGLARPKNDPRELPFVE